MEWIKKLMQSLGFKKKSVKVFVSYEWQSEDKIGTGNSVLDMDRMPNSWNDIVTMKTSLADYNLKDYPGATVMIIHYCKMG